MRTRINWPDTYTHMSGMDRFCGGPEYEDISASDFLHWAKPIVDSAIINLETEIDELQLEVNRLKNLVSEKPRVKYNNDIQAWVIVDATDSLVNELKV